MIEIQNAPQVKQKEGVDINTLTSLCKLAVYITKHVFEKAGYSYTLTSTTDGQHCLDSLHYTGNAFDSRTRHIKDQEKLDLIAVETYDILERLDRDFQVIIEKTHLHIELDRRYKNETLKN